MAAPPIPDEQLKAAVDALATHGTQIAAAAALKMSRQGFQNRLQRAAERGLAGFAPVLPGFKVAKVSNTPNGDYIQQKPDRGAPYKPIDALNLTGRTTWAEVLPDGSRLATREVLMERAGAADQAAARRAAIEALQEQIPRAEPVPAPQHCMTNMLSQYTITDSHLGAMAWNAETGRGDYDLAIGEKLLIDWFGAAIASAPSSRRAVFAQLGDFLHHDSFKSITPEHGHILDADSRYPKMVRVAIRVVRQVIRMLLEKHEEVNVIMADANHDPVGEVWLREMLAVLYENEPRIKVDTNPGTYSLVEHDDVSLFYHHGHRRGMKNVDSMMAGRFREAYGRTRFSYCHIGHKHANELKRTDLMEVEMHETLAAPDAYGSNWLSGRSAKRIDYHAHRGEVGRNIITAEMVADGAWS